MVTAVNAAAAKGDKVVLVIDGAYFGLATYAAYDLTNLGTLRDWPWVVRRNN